MKTNLILVSLLFCSLFSLAQTKEIECDSRKSVERHTQALRDAVYASVINLKETDAIKPATIAQYKVQYGEISKGFNDVFALMKDDLSDWKSKKKVCKKYSNQLNAMVLKADKFILDVDKEFQADENSLGGADLIKWLVTIFDFVDTTVEKFADRFYDKVKWDSWEKIEQQ